MNSSKGKIPEGRTPTAGNETLTGTDPDGNSQKKQPGKRRSTAGRKITKAKEKDKE